MFRFTYRAQALNSSCLIEVIDMKRLKSGLLLLLPLALCACGDGRSETVYSFQMGKQSGAHMTASITLTEKPFIMEGVAPGSKSLTLYGQIQMGRKSSSQEQLSSAASEPLLSSEETSFELSSEAISAATSEDSAVTIPDDMDIQEYIMNRIMELLGIGVSINGWYSIGEVGPSGRNKMKIGFDLKSVFPDIEESLILGPEYIEQIVFSEYDGKTIYLAIPVSFDDVVYQLYWYGFDILDFSTEGITEHEVGTHPTAEDVAEINKVYTTKHPDRVYRDFYCISMGLKKE